MSQLSKNPKAVSLGFGMVFVVIGVLSMLGMLLWPAGVKTEFWVAEVAALGFVFAGLAFVAQSLGRKNIALLFSLAVVAVLGLTGAYFLFW